MARFEVPLDTAGKPISATIAALSGRALPVLEGETKVHPYRSIPAAGSRFARALEEFLNGLETSEAEIHSTDSDVLPQSFENLCYRAAELFEVYEKLPNVVNFRPNKSFKEIAKTYRTATDNATSDWAKLCNFVKHNSNIIMPIRYAYTPSRVVVSGFGLCEPKPGAAVDINVKFHQNGERRRSFNIALQQMIYSVMRCDFLAAGVIKSLPDQDCEKLPHHEATLDIATSLKRIAARPDFAVPTQPLMFNGMTLDKSVLILHRKRALLVNEDAQVRTRFTADGYTTTFPYA